MKIRILGCGPSSGIPSLSRGFGKCCDPNEPKNIRTRSAALVQTDDDKNILIDSGPDIRMQLLRIGSPKIDAVLYTHPHYDHIGGINDLIVCASPQNKLPIFVAKNTAQCLKKMVPHLFLKEKTSCVFDLTVIQPYSSFWIGNTMITPIKQYHGSSSDARNLSIGYRIGTMAYSTDMKEIDEAGFDLLKDLNTWVLGVISEKPNYKHAHLKGALDWINVLQPKQTFLTHMGSELDYGTLCKNLPENVYPSYDNLLIDNEV